MKADETRTYGLFNLYDPSGRRIFKEMTTAELTEAGVIPKGTSLTETADRGGSYHGMIVEQVADLTSNQYRAHVLRKQGYKIPDYVVPWLHCCRADKIWTVESLVYFCGLRHMLGLD